MIGGIVFEHGKELVAVIIDQTTHKIIHQCEISIPNNGDSDPAVYVNLFSRLTIWLDNFDNVPFFYSGPKLTGTGPQFTRRHQRDVYDPGNDSKALIDVLSPYSVQITFANPKPKIITKSKAIVGLIFQLDYTDTSKIWACAIAFKGFKGNRFSYSHLAPFLESLEEYEDKKILIDEMLPASQRKYDYSALKKAKQKWMNPTGKYLARKQNFNANRRRSLNRITAEIRLA